MQDITIFTATTDIKPELSKIYVHEIGSQGIKYAVTTDSFRLVRVKLPDILQEYMPVGYYQVKAWKEIVKAYNKKNKDIKVIMDTIAGQKVLQDQYKDYYYPEYTQIIPTDDELESFNDQYTFNKDYLLDFITLIHGDKFGNVSLKDIKQSKSRKMIIYKTEDITILLMASITR